MNDKSIGLLLEDMQQIFGESFGSAEPLVEARKFMPPKMPPMAAKRQVKGAAPAPKGPRDKGKAGKAKLAKAKDAAAKTFAKVMGDIQGDIKRGEEDSNFKKFMASFLRDVDTANEPKEPEAKKSAKMPIVPKSKGRDSSRRRSGGAGAAAGIGGGGSASPKGGGGGGAPQGGGRSKHFPFKRSANLGKGPLNQYHDETKCWKCKCGNIYSTGCRCIGTGKSQDCKKGEVRQVSVDKPAKQAYNRLYHKWRAKQGGAVTGRLGATRQTA